MSKRMLTDTEVACWVLKGNPAVFRLYEAWRDGVEIASWRVFRTYRLDLMEAGQPCLLWLSGKRSSGVIAIGRLSGRPNGDIGGGPYWKDIEERDRPRPYVPVSLHLLAHEVPRATLVADERFAAAEIVRVPNYSNPSYLTNEQLEAVKEQLSDPDLKVAGWAE